MSPSTRRSLCTPTTSAPDVIVKAAYDLPKAALRSRCGIARFHARLLLPRRQPERAHHGCSRRRLHVLRPATRPSTTKTAGGVFGSARVCHPAGMPTLRCRRWLAYRYRPLRLLAACRRNHPSGRHAGTGAQLPRPVQPGEGTLPRSWTRMPTTVASMRSGRCTAMRTVPCWDTVAPQPEQRRLLCAAAVNRRQSAHGASDRLPPSHLRLAHTVHPGRHDRVRPTAL